MGLCFFEIIKAFSKLHHYIQSLIKTNSKCFLKKEIYYTSCKIWQNQGTFLRTRSLIESFYQFFSQQRQTCSSNFITNFLLYLLKLNLNFQQRMAEDNKKYWNFEKENTLMKLLDDKTCNDWPTQIPSYLMPCDSSFTILEYQNYAWI